MQARIGTEHYASFVQAMLDHDRKYEEQIGNI